MAIKKGLSDTVKLLLDRGADTSRKDKVKIVNIYFLYVPF